MLIKRSFNDESGVSTVIETVLLFGISIIFLGVIYSSFNGLNERQTQIVMKEQYLSLGNAIANRMSEITINAKSSLSGGAAINIKSDIYMPLKIADNTYSVKLATGKIILESTSGPYVKVIIPIGNNINLADNSTLSSTGDKFELMYDSQSGAIFFTEGGVIPAPDFNAPAISFIAPDEDATISNTTLIDVTTWDDVGVTKVEYYVDGIYKYTSGEDWLWDTRTMSSRSYNVTAVAYDSAGHSKAATRRLTLSNGISSPPVITIVSPVNLESTDFRRPIIEFKISDDVGIDFDSITLSVDGVNRISNVTKVIPRFATLTYIPSSDMNISPPNHNVEVHVNDMDGTESVAIWDFTIIPITDSDNPTVKIEWPLSSSDILIGDEVKVQYKATDASSGLENLSIDITRNDSKYYTYFEQKSKYGNIIRDTGSVTQPFSNFIVDGKKYTYNITVYDRTGKNNSTSVAFISQLTGDARFLVVDTNSKLLVGTQLNNIKVSNKDSGTIKISKIRVIWTPNNSSQNIKNINIGGSDKWTGNSQSGNLLTLTSSYKIMNSEKIMDLTFDSNMSGKEFTLFFQMSDSTTKAVTFNT